LTSLRFSPCLDFSPDEEVAVLVELSMVEQRYQAVREVIASGDPITVVAARYGVDRRTLHRWLTKYANGGLEALATRSNRPDTCPHQMDPVIEARLVVMRRSHPGWGPRTLRTKLREEFDPAPSSSACIRVAFSQKVFSAADLTFPSATVTVSSSKRQFCEPIVPSHDSNQASSVGATTTGGARWLRVQFDLMKRPGRP
jgi:transposase